MKKCKWCNSNIEDTAVICPYCKANQNSDNNANTGKSINHVQSYVENPKKYDNKAQATKSNAQINVSKDIHQMAEDIHFIRKFITVMLILSIVLGVISGLAMIGF